MQNYQCWLMMSALCFGLTACGGEGGGNAMLSATNAEAGRASASVAGLVGFGGQLTATPAMLADMEEPAGVA